MSLSWITKLPALVEFGAFYLVEVVKSNLQVALDIITPQHRMSPAWLEVDVSELTNRQLLLVANLITMTPGTLSVDLNADCTHLRIHGMYVKDAAAEARHLETAYLGRVRRVC